MEEPQKFRDVSELHEVSLFGQSKNRNELKRLKFMFHTELLSPDEGSVCRGLFPKWEEPGLVEDQHLGPTGDLSKELHRGMVDAAADHGLIAIVIRVDMVLVIESSGGYWSLV